MSTPPPQPSWPIDRAALSATLESLAPRSAYARGVLDLLHVLGLVRSGADGVSPADEVAAMVLDSLRAHLADGVSVGLPWGDLDAGGLRGVDVLRAIETARLDAVSSPTPGRVVRVVQAVIKGRRGGEDVYLMQYDRHAGRYQPIGGKQEPDDDGPEAALRREMAEELSLKTPPGPADCTLIPLRLGWRTSEVSATYGILTAYQFDFFAVQDIRFPLPADENTRWLTRAEVVAEQASDGRAVSPVYMAALGGLAALDTLPPGTALTGE